MTSTDLAIPNEYDDGLEDLTGADLQVPRLKIGHADGVFVDSATSEQYNEIFCVILGLVRQRVLFHHIVENDDVPMCKSPDFTTGYPNVNHKEKRLAFPWEGSGFDPASAAVDEEGRIVLPCEACKLKDWGAHPADGKRPYCSEQMTLPILFAGSMEEFEARQRQPALITMQKVGIKPTKTYLGPFKQKQVGAYTAVTKLSLVTAKRGQVTYATPVFKRMGDTDPDEHPDFSTQYRAIRQFLVESKPQAPEGYVAPDEVATTVAPSTPAPATQPAASRPMAQPAFVGGAKSAPVVQTVEATTGNPADDDDLPF